MKRSAKHRDERTVVLRIFNLPYIGGGEDAKDVAEKCFIAFQQREALAGAG
jgi:hypothetical protein